MKTKQLYSWGGIELSIDGVAIRSMQEVNYESSVERDPDMEDLEVCSEIHEEPILSHVELELLGTVFRPYGDSLDAVARQCYGVERKLGESDSSLAARLLSIFPKI